VPADDIRVAVVGAAEFEPLVPAAAHVYGAAMGRSAELVVQRREIMQSHLHRSGFAAATATAGADLVGFGYGYRGRRGEWWHDTVARAIGRSAAKRWLDQAFEIAELHVLPDFHGQGVGRRLLDLLLDRADGSTVVLSTHDRESPARSLYRSAGFTELQTGFVFPGSAEVYAIMGRDR
jgi:ribosomal protein S18 acetylase RimI-like enzyme